MEESLRKEPADTVNAQEPGNVTFSSLHTNLSTAFRQYMGMQAPNPLARTTALNKISPRYHAHLKTGQGLSQDLFGTASTCYATGCLTSYSCDKNLSLIIPPVPTSPFHWTLTYPITLTQVSLVFICAEYLGSMLFPGHF